MQHSVVLSTEECVELLRRESVGRVAFTTSDGPRIVPVNYTLTDNAIIIRTSPYSELGTQAVGARVAFEVDELDHEHLRGWSVVAIGRAELIEDADELRDVRAQADPEPWPTGVRNLYLRLLWRELTGRRIG